MTRSFGRVTVWRHTRYRWNGETALATDASFSHANSFLGSSTSRRMLSRLVAARSVGALI